MKKYCFGIDIGGTTVKCGLFNVDGEVLDKWEIKTRTENNGENIIADIAETMRRIAYAEKYQSIYAQMEEASYEDYDFSGDAYSKLLEKQDYSINKNVVKRLGVGSITLQY